MNIAYAYSVKKNSERIKKNACAISAKLILTEMELDIVKSIGKCEITRN